ncbi:Alkaline phosphatase [Candidatus Rhodobacter oscarellae]|uniref:Alkaline phosphatase n=1 Tax=Candidatus Rhodobacter oscarellae TaxID=1675527 RepID=A0A0J9E151_9RHOB|nr:Hint domain-containing protein [Candidatus Rhodobacter lobularis]KMW56417.1 Alkaline phosphatase [Candidatus Rhodobacter lobularis]
MATYWITTSNWNDAAFWSSVSETTNGHTLDFSALPSNYSVLADYGSGRVTISDGTTTFIVGEPGDGGADANFGGSTDLDLFDCVIGSEGDDTIEGATSGSADFFDGGGGNDSINSGGGADTVLGGDGNDTINGYAGNDSIEGGAGDDSIQAEFGDDTVLGGAGSDTIDGYAGHDSIDGGADNDSLTGENGNDTLIGGSGDDTLLGENDDDSLDGGIGNDTLDGGSGNDTLLGDDGADSLVGGGGLDSLDGGDGNDTLQSGWHDDTVEGGAGDDSISGGSGDDLLRGGDDNDSINGWADNDLIYGDAGDDSLIGEQGNDTLYGGTGNDSLHGQGGADALYGEGGDDYIQVDTDNQDDLVVGGETDETAGDTLLFVDNNGLGIDVTYSGDEAGTGTNNGNVTTFSEIENLVLGDNADTVDGSADTAGLNIDGGAGDDSITAGQGDDLLTGGAGEDVYTFQSGTGADTISDFDLGDDDSDGFFNDQIDVSALTDADGNPVNAWDVTVSDDGFGNALLTFPNGETVLLEGVAPAQIDEAQELFAAGIPCFCDDTLIATRKGEVPVQELRPGDMVRTLDHGEQPVRWIGQRSYDAETLRQHPKHRPILIGKGALGNHSPLLVSPLHGMLVGPDQGLLGEGFARAKDLMQVPGAVRRAKGKRAVRYNHVLLPQHAVIFANGAATESFYPGPESLCLFGLDQIATLERILPGIGSKPVGDIYGPTARPYLRAQEVKCLVNLRARGRAQFRARLGQGLTRMNLEPPLGALNAP